jgi:hypothetical protein
MSEENEEDRIAAEIRRKLATNDLTTPDFKTVLSRRDPNRNFDLRDPEEAKKYLDNLEIEYTFQCLKEKMPDGCHRLANFMENIRGNYKDATELYKKNCDENKFGRSCFTYSKNRSLGRGNVFDFDFD